MPSPRIFIDTSFLFPFFAAHDPDHERVSRVFEAYREHFRAGALVTTNHIIFEAITLIRYRGSRDPHRAHELAERVGETLYSGRLGPEELGSGRQSGDAPSSTCGPGDLEYSDPSSEFS